LGREYSDPASNDYIDKLISEIDEDGDGRVSYDDFKYALSKAVDTKIKQLIEKCESFAA
jgi:Ca2+-binding EF-hand superfamily protein